MKYVQAYLAYLRDNPKHYWFKRKVYGWGWTPATREGWFVTGLFVLFVFGVVVRAEQVAVSEESMWWEVVLPVVMAVLVFLLVCYKTGESPRWQWRLPKKYFKE